MGQPVRPRHRRQQRRHGSAAFVRDHGARQRRDCATELVPGRARRAQRHGVERLRERLQRALESQPVCVRPLWMACPDGRPAAPGTFVLHPRTPRRKPHVVSLAVHRIPTSPCPSNVWDAAGTDVRVPTCRAIRQSRTDWKNPSTGHPDEPWNAKLRHPGPMHNALAQRGVRIEILVDAPISQRPRAKRYPHGRQVRRQQLRRRGAALPYPVEARADARTPAQSRQAGRQAGGGAR